MVKESFLSVENHGLEFLLSGGNPELDISEIFCSRFHHFSTRNSAVIVLPPNCLSPAAPPILKCLNSMCVAS